MAAMEKKDKTLNVPPLRFPEFSGEWEKYLLKSIANIYDGTHQTPKYTKSGVPFMSVEDITKKSSSEQKYISEQDFHNDFRNPPQKGDILMTRIGDIGTPCIVSTDEALGYYVSLALIRPLEKLQSSFLNYVIQSDSFKRELYKRTIHVAFPQKINKEDIGKCKLDVPSIEEQSRIGNLLSLIDERITTQRKIIEKHESLIRGLYHSVFNQPAVALQLNDVVSVVKGKQVNGEDLLEDGKYYMMNGGTEPSGYLDEYNTPANTISISEGGNSCGYVQYNTEPFWSGGHCYSLIQKEVNINYQYLYHFLKYKERDIMALRIGSGLPNVQKKDLERFEIRLLPIEQQNRVAEILEGLSAKCGLEKRVLQRWQSQKSFLLRNLFI